MARLIKRTDDQIKAAVFLSRAVTDHHQPYSPQSPLHIYQPATCSRVDVSCYQYLITDSERIRPEFLFLIYNTLSLSQSKQSEVFTS